MNRLFESFSFQQFLLFRLLVIIIRLIQHLAAKCLFLKTFSGLANETLNEHEYSNFGFVRVAGKTKTFPNIKPRKQKKYEIFANGLCRPSKYFAKCLVQKSFLHSVYRRLEK